MDKEFLTRLRSSLEMLDTRITTLEHLVNDTIIGSLKQAADEYEDDAKFSDFCDRHSEFYEPYVEKTKILYGDDYDLPSELYDNMKNAEGYGTDTFDENSYVDSILDEIQDKIDQLQEMKDSIEEETE